MRSTRVANELGAGNPEGARSAVRVVMSIAVTEAVIVSGTLLLSRRLLGRAYSSEEQVVSAVAAMVPLVCITVVTDGLQGVLSGDLRSNCSLYSVLTFATKCNTCFLIRHCSRMRMAARGRIHQPRFVLLARNSNGDAPRFCAEHGSKRALDRCCLWVDLADHASLGRHIFHKLAKDGLFLSLAELRTQYAKTNSPMHHWNIYTYLTIHCVCLQADKARERSLNDKAMESESRYLLE